MPTVTTNSPAPYRNICGAKNRSGGPCGRPAGWGTPSKVGRCKLHGGLSPNGRKNAERLELEAACSTLGIQVQTSPAEALLNEIRETAGNVEFYRRLVQDLQTHPAADTYVAGNGDGDGHWERGEPGIYGRTYHQSGSPTGEAKPHVLVQLYNDERKHLAQTTVAALKVGIAAQAVELASRQAELIAEGFRSFAVALGHDPADPKVREAFRAQLTLIAGGRAA